MVAADAERRPLPTGGARDTPGRQPQPGRATKHNAGGGTRTPKGVSPPAPKAGA